MADNRPRRVSDDTSESEQKERLFAEYVDRLLAGEWLDHQFIQQQHPTIGVDLVEQLRSFQELADLPGQDRPPHQLDDFEIVREIGRGGMGVVYEAIQISLGRQVALKILPFVGMLDPRQIQRFSNEAQAAAQLHHTNIVPIHAVGCAQGIHYYAMQYIDGRNLAELLRHLRENQPAAAVGSGEIPSQPAPEAVVQQSDAGETDYDSQPELSSQGTIQEPWSQSLHQQHSRSSKRAYYHTVVKLGIEAAEAIAHAHCEQVVHRDIKPSNLLIDERGKLWITDFGLAKMQDSAELTLTGDFVGTLRYMSPEQIQQPDQVDHRTDIYSLGVTLYELLALRPPFEGSSREALLEKVVNSEPKSLRSIDRQIPRELETIIAKATEKEAVHRYPTAQHFADDLRRLLDDRPIHARRASLLQRSFKWVRRHKAQSALGASIVLVLALLGLMLSKYRSEQLAKQREARIRQITEYVQTEDFIPAFKLLQIAKSKSPHDPGWAKLDLKTAAAIDIECDVPGVQVSIQKFDGDQDWYTLGSSPFNRLQVPLGVHRWRAQKEGYVTREFLQEVEPAGTHILLHMYATSQYPSHMVPVLPRADREPSPANPPKFLVDQYETTNLEYQEFVDQGGYHRREFWQEKFEEGGRDSKSTLTFDEAMQRFRDLTGKHGPATWRDGRFVPGTDDFPVGGVSWFEAAAFARFRNKSLPTLYHWRKVAGLDLAAVNLVLSHFDGSAPVAVGQHRRAVTQHGLYDTAGNIREWCYNAQQDTENHRFALGGSYLESSNMWSWKTSFSAWKRDPDFGFRCVRYLDDEQTPPKTCFKPIVVDYPMDYGSRDPASAADVEIRKKLYRYDKQQPLNARIEGSADSVFANTETISIDASYDEDRIRFKMHLPKGFQPPYQVVVYNNGAAGFWQKKLEDSNDSLMLSYLVDSGRILVASELFGHYGRSRQTKRGLLGTQERRVKRAKDLMRVVDYLETRTDVDMSRIGYLGASTGAHTGPLNLVVDERYRLGVLLDGGLPRYECLPSCDPYDFAPQVRVPVMMVNGRNDVIYPYLESQRPLFELLNMPEDNSGDTDVEMPVDRGANEIRKRHVVNDGGHGLYAYANRQNQGDIVDWLDTYLGIPARQAK